MGSGLKQGVILLSQHTDNNVVPTYRQYEIKSTTSCGQLVQRQPGTPCLWSVVGSCCEVAHHRDQNTNRLTLQLDLLVGDLAPPPPTPPTPPPPTPTLQPPLPTSHYPHSPLPQPLPPTLRPPLPLSLPKPPLPTTPTPHPATPNSHYPHFPLPLPPTSPTPYNGVVRPHPGQLRGSVRSYLSWLPYHHWGHYR